MLLTVSRGNRMTRRAMRRETALLKKARWIAVRRAADFRKKALSRLTNGGIADSERQIVQHLMTVVRAHCWDQIVASTFGFTTVLFFHNRFNDFIHIHIAVQMGGLVEGLQFSSRSVERRCVK